MKIAEKEIPSEVMKTERNHWVQTLRLHGCSAGIEQVYRWGNYLLSSWRRVLLKKKTGFRLVKKFTAFYGTPWFITALTSARHLSLSWTSSIQSIPPYSTSWRSILKHYSQRFIGPAIAIHHIARQYITVLSTCLIVSLSTAAVRGCTGRCWLSIP